MASYGFTLFGTAIGRCGIGWDERGIVAVQLPETSDGETRARLIRRSLGADETHPPPAVQGAIDSIVALLRGEARDLSAVVLDMDGLPEFHRCVYQIVRTIAPGATLSYGDIAVRLGNPAAAREVGQALGRNPFPIIVPCHRVVATDGKLGGFSARGGTTMKRRLLAIEGAHAIPLPLFR